MTNTTLLEKIQEKTIADVKMNLKEFSKCLLVRPTGYGKTHISMQIAADYEKIVVIHPSYNIKRVIEEKINLNDLGDKVKYIGYIACGRRERQKILETEFSGYDYSSTLFILDECHHMAAPVTSIGMEALMNRICPKAHFLGMTATPERTDKMEIPYHYFDGHNAFDYTFHDAIKDGIFKKPYYVYTFIHPESILKNTEEEIDKMHGVTSIKKKHLKEEIRKTLNIKKYNVENLSEIINENKDKFKRKNEYYKFLCFFSTFAKINNRKDVIASEFRKAFPNHEVNVFVITSENKKYKLNFDVVSDLKVRKNEIDLIFSINMLGEGVHFENTTGVLMFRQTISDIVYSQQVGRTLQVNSEESCIIFDFVENYSRFDLFNTFNNPNKRTKRDGFSISGIDKDDVIMDAKTLNILEIERLIKRINREELEKEIVSAYGRGLITISYCCERLSLQTEDDFIKVIRRYTDGNKEKIM